MHKVVDSNFLQTDALRAYLSNSLINHVVLTDYVFMEAYKGNTLSSIHSSMAIFCEYGAQVIVLKPTSVICGLSGSSDGLRRRLIYDVGTGEFSGFCRDLLSAKRGDGFLQRSFLDHGRVATAFMDRQLANSANIARIIEDIANCYTATELKLIRTGSPITDTMMDKLIKSVLDISAFLCAAHPNVTQLPTAAELPNTFIFRAALSILLLAWRWIGVGGAGKVKDAARLRNDMVDSFLAAYATYFDGLLTFDRKLRQLYAGAVVLLKTISETGA